MGDVMAGKAVSDGRFAAGNAAGESDDEHGPSLGEQAKDQAYASYARPDSRR